MSAARANCRWKACGRYASPRTYIASGNVVFETDKTEQQVKAKLESRLKEHAGKSVGVIVRSATEIADVVRRNPFPEQPRNRVMVLFSDSELPHDPFDGASGVAREQVHLGRREMFIYYPDGQANTRLRLPAMTDGTARNLNTVSKLHAMLGGAG